MIITITLASPPADRQKLPPPLAKISHDEYVLIELQGKVNVECNDGADRNGQLVGNLKIDEVGNKPTLTIGHHLLEGKIVSLTKPLAILVRSEMGGHSTDDKEWCIAALVKRKIVFSKRPMPINK
ncbi:Ctf8-domain-containing protein [Amanita rubescens]|nr:Ctf8-domain-containing protein [Amanita rubescens]